MTRVLSGSQPQVRRVEWFQRRDYRCDGGKLRWKEAAVSGMGHNHGCDFSAVSETQPQL